MRKLILALLLTGCPGPSYVEYPRDETVCEAACTRLQMLGCQEGSHPKCVPTCDAQESAPYLRPMASCVLHETDVRKCGVECHAIH